jgi:hypothetical protein
MHSDEILGWRMLMIQKSWIHLLQEKKLNFQNIYTEFQKKQYTNPFWITVHEEEDIFVYLAHIKPVCNRRRREEEFPFVLWA